jgi:GntR family transcriptional regulator / MocR family aminotransferase
MVGQLTYGKALADGGSPALDQLALADFIARGELDRHLRRMRNRYGQRRASIEAALARVLPEARVTGARAGLYALVELPGSGDEPGILRAAAAGIGVEGATAGRISSRGPPGVVLGYANLSEPAIERGIELLAAAIGSG